MSVIVEGTLKTIHFLVFPSQAEGVQEMATMVGAVPAVEQKEELFDPLAPPDVDK